MAGRRRYARGDMSREIRTIRGAIYVVTPTEDGCISLVDGTVISTFSVGRQTPFVAPAKAVMVSDEHAAVDIYLNSSSPIALGGSIDEALKKHPADGGAHLSPAERRCLAAYVPHFAEAETLPEEAPLAVAQDTDTMNTENNTSWLAGLLTGWGIRESWAKIIAGAIVGALAAAGFLTSCSENLGQLAELTLSLVAQG